MAERMKENVFPTIDGTKHARLIYYYMLMQECEDKDGTLKVQILPFVCILLDWAFA